MHTHVFEDSSNVVEARHDGHALFIKFHHGGVYKYDAPVTSFDSLITAESAGKYIHAHLKQLAPVKVDALPEDDSLPVGASLVFKHDDMPGQVFNMKPRKINELPVDIVILNDAIKVEYAKAGDAAFDLRADIPEAIIILAGQRQTIMTGIKVSIPQGFVGMVTPRSGSAHKSGISVTNSPGLIDSGYRGEVGVIFENRGSEPYPIQPLDRIAQFAIVPVFTAKFNFVEDLDETTRGVGGFGSSGVQ